MFSGEHTQETDHVPNISFNSSIFVNFSEYTPIYREQTQNMHSQNSFNNVVSHNSFSIMDNQNPPVDTLETIEKRISPPPLPSYFLGYTLPPGHPCNSFTLPPPPADKKRTGPRRKILLPIQRLLIFHPIFFYGCQTEISVYIQSH